LSTRKSPIEKNQSTKLTRFKGRLWVSHTHTHIYIHIYIYIYIHIYIYIYIYIYSSNKDLEERKSSIEILTKVVLQSFYKPMVLGCL
jgi:hypothetical protein